MTDGNLTSDYPANGSPSLSTGEENGGVQEVIMDGFKFSQADAQENIYMQTIIQV